MVSKYPKWPWEKNFSNIKRDITLEKVQELVNALLWKQSNVIVGTTGSSGRNEEYASLDELELLLYPNVWMSGDEIKDFQETVQRYTWRCDIIFEHKTKMYPEFFEFVERRWTWKPVFFPSRFIDFLQLHWSQEEYTELVDIFLWNIRAHNAKTLEWWKKRIATHKKVSENGLIRWQGQDIPLFNDGDKMLHYEKSPWGREISIKIWALRYIQYQIVQMLMVLIRRNSIDKEVFQQIWNGVESKIDFLSDHGLNLGMIQLQELKWLYSFFLWIHNNISKAFHKDGAGSMIFSDEDYRIFKERLSDFNNLMAEFRLKEK